MYSVFSSSIFSVGSVGSDHNSRLLSPHLTANASTNDSFSSPSLLGQRTPLAVRTDTHERKHIGFNEQLLHAGLRVPSMVFLRRSVEPEIRATKSRTLKCFLGHLE